MAGSETSGSKDFIGTCGMMKSSTRVTSSSPIRKVVMGFPLPNHAVVFAEASNRQLGNGALLSHLRRMGSNGRRLSSSFSRYIYRAPQPDERRFFNKIGQNATSRDVRVTAALPLKRTSDVGSGATASGPISGL